MTVRMYDVGFGDAFLVSVPTGEATWRMLVDCGVHSQGRSEHDMDDVVADIVASCTGPDRRAWLDVVVGTHRHRDHVSGFDSQRWAAVGVGEVWLPWTEDPDDSEASGLRATHDAAAAALQLALAGDPDRSALAMNSLTNERAMWTLRQGFTGAPLRRYVAADAGAQQELTGLPGGSVRFLGPPRDEAAIRAMDPPRSQRWFGPADGAALADPGPAFAPEFVLGAEDYRRRFPGLTLPGKLFDRLLLDEDDAFGAATWLDRCVNNTSVMFLLQVGAARLLFPGDAQWGSWRALLESPATRALLATVDVYKVSHHGSHNGTPTGMAREVLSQSVTSMLSVRAIARWAEVPKTELVDELGGGSRLVVRSDQPAPQPARRHPEGLWIELDVPC